MLHRDGMCLVLNKPAGMACHGQFGKGESLTPLLQALSFGKERRPELVHRLDQATSGCLLMGRHPKALRELQDQMLNGQIAKRYLAVICGRLEAEGTIDLPLSEKNKQGKVCVDSNGKAAVTQYRSLGTLQIGEQTGQLLELIPVTGRTHQLRVHLAAKGCPIVGDRTYGGVAWPQLLLHAYTLEIPQGKPKQKKPPLKLVAPLPAYWPAEAASLLHK
jgi:tRNA pseudouridine32 synthase/23S rRNA pseudouridine746 synthase